jgi:type I restriction enzyme, S subunit
MNAEVKPGYKLAEVGVIPEDWEVKTIDEVGFVTSGKRLPLGSSLTERETSHPYVRVTDMRFGTVSLSDIKFVPDDVYPVISRYRIFRDDIFISVAGTLGIVGKVPDELDGANLTENADRITKITCCQEYLLHVLMSPLIQNTIQSLQTVGAQPKLALTRIRKFAITFPPTKAEQESIAEALSDADALIESLEQLITKKRQIKQGAMQELLTGKKRLLGFSGEWEIKRLGDLFTFSGGYSASRDQLSCEGHCYLHYGDIHGSSKMIVDTKVDYQNIPKLKIPLKRIASNSLLRDGDVVFVDASEDDEGTSKYIVVVNKDDVPFIAGLHTIVAKSKTSELTHEYRCYCFQTASVHQQFLFFAVGKKVSGISKSNIPKLTLPVPPYPEQAAIAEILMDMDSEIDVLEVKLDKARHLKQGMMYNLLTGKIRLL